MRNVSLIDLRSVVVATPRRVTLIISKVNKCLRLLCVGLLTAPSRFTSQHVMLVFDAVTPSDFVAGVSCPATHQDRLVRFI